MKTIIAGSRSITDYDVIKKYIKVFEETHGKISLVISGTAKGVDELGERYANENNIPLSRFPADWDKHGKKAGILRNIEMANNANALIAFWDGKSKGTKHMIDTASKKHLIISAHVI
jgi:recombinational DNA repair protein (RecF pathway)